MAIDKTIDYVIQDGYNNYTKNSKSVTVPKKFKARKNAPATKLAYITEAEAKQLKKQNPGTPHKGPSGVPSYDSFDAQGNYSSGAAMSAAETGGNTDRDRRDMAQAGISPQEAQAIRSAAINAGAGQRVNPGFFDSRTNLTPAEIRAAKKARRDPNNLYGAKSFRNTGQSGIMNLIRSGGLLGSLARGIGQFFGLGKRPGEATYDMSEFNDLGLLTDRVNPTFQNDLGNELMLSTQKTPERFLPNAGPRQVNIPAGDAVSTLASSKFNRMKGYTDDYPNLGLIPSTKEIPTVNGVSMIDTGSVYQDNLDFFDNLNKGIVEGGTLTDNYKYKVPFEGARTIVPNPDYKDVMQGSVLDAQPKKGIMQKISDLFFTPAGAAEITPAIKAKDTGLGFSVPTGDVGLNASGRLGSLSATVDAIEALKGESVNPELNYSGQFGNTNVYGNYSDDVQNIGLNFNNDKGLSGGISYDAITGEPRFDIGFRRTFADGGLASMFTRRG